MKHENNNNVLDILRNIACKWRIHHLRLLRLLPSRLSKHHLQPRASLAVASSELMQHYRSRLRVVRADRRHHLSVVLPLACLHEQRAFFGIHHFQFHHLLHPLSELRWGGVFRNDVLNPRRTSSLCIPCNRRASAHL